MNHEQWKTLRDRLKPVTTCDRKMEMVVDTHLQGLHVMQFHIDLPMYGLYEAVLLSPEETFDALSDEIAELFKPRKPVELPSARTLELMEKHGKVAASKTCPTTFRPESIVMLNEKLVRAIVFDGATQKMFERTLPPHIADPYIKRAQEFDVYEAVKQVPYAYREAICARLIKMHDIPLPPEPKTKAKHIVAGAPKVERDKVLVIDKAGHAWTWAYGWFRINEAGQAIKPGARHLGHVEFRRVIIPAGPDDFRRTSFHYTRPWGQWRRGTGPVSHPLFGNGNMTITDGVHAIVEFADGIKREVELANLNNIGVRVLKRETPTSSTPRKPREPKKVGKMTLEELMKFL